MARTVLHLLILAMSCAGCSTSCPRENFEIHMGEFSLSAGYSEGSVLRYTCPEGHYPTVLTRKCKMGRWIPKPKTKLMCNKITCPNPRGFTNGDVSPFQPRYFVNDITKYSCDSSYTFSGSATRICQPNGKWSGGTPICGRNSDHCPDPGTPPGTLRSGFTFNIDDKVMYQCENGWSLIGSRKRVCQDNGQWSGTEPQCYASFTYDTPEEASESFSTSLNTNLELSQQHEETDQYGKRIQVHKGGKLDIYIALDVSDSIDEVDFEKAKEVIMKLIEKISYYEVSPNYEILIFATDVTRIVSMTDFKRGQSNNLSESLKKLKDFKYDGMGTGTNIAKAYFSILESMQIEMDKDKESFLQTQHIVIMFTDGHANMGGNPKPKVDKIKHLVINDDPSREEKLDLYVFGMGPYVNVDDINHLKTDRGHEKFFFKLGDLDDLKQTFDNMIDEGTSVKLCGLYKDYNDGMASHERRQYPWLANIQIAHKGDKRSNCLGSLVTPSFILTAAHCFRFDDIPSMITVNLGSKVINALHYIRHPNYNITAKRHMGIPEYYEFDVALIQLKEAVVMDPNVRPICIPCTKETSGALKLSDSQGTCKKHEEMLMGSENVNAAFMSHVKARIEKKHIKIKQGNLRDACVEDAKKAKGITATKATDIVTNNFLCSGGIEPNTDDIACKGDSGGATFVVPGLRMVQVGIVSWGTKDLCKSNSKPLSVKDSRDYHTNLFSPEIRKFLKTYLGNGRLGTPLTFL